MKYQGSNISVNCCTTCKKQLTLVADKLRYSKCAQCNHLNNIGVYTIEQYNEWLRK